MVSRVTNFMQRLMCCAIVLVLGCGGAAKPRTATPFPITPAKANPVANIAVPIPVGELRVTPDDTQSDASRPAHELFDGAMADYRSGRLPKASGAFRQLVDTYPDSKLAPLALYNVAAIFDAQQQAELMLATLHEYLERYPKHINATFVRRHLAAVQAEKGAYAQAEAALVPALTDSSLQVGDRIEILARLGYVQLRQGNVAAASASLEEGHRAWRGAPVRTDMYYPAMINFYRGEVAYVAFVDAPIDQTGVSVKQDLLRKEQAAVQAYDKWREALGFREPYWSTAAGYRMSHIYMEFWTAVVTSPRPPKLQPAAESEYRRQLRAKLRNFLETAAAGHRMNIELGVAFGTETVWTRESKVELEKILGLLDADPLEPEIPGKISSKSNHIN